MNYHKNPFYILEVTSLDGRDIIYDSAESKSLLHDNKEVIDAKNNLVTPRKRLKAELRWFPGLSIEDKYTIRKFLDSISEKSIDDYPDITNYSVLTRLNLEIYKLKSMKSEELAEIKRLILLIIRHYNELDSEKLMGIINKDRGVSGFSNLNNIQEIQVELHNYQEDISRTIHEVILSLKQEDYRNVIENLAKRYCEKEGYFSGNVTIETIISKYELNVKHESEKLKMQIISAADQATINRNNYKEKLSIIIYLFNNWHSLVHPLHLVDWGKGLSRPGSVVEITNALREISSTIVNEFKDTREALNFLSKIIESFSLWPEAYNRIASDIEAIRVLKMSVKPRQINKEKEDTLVDHNNPQETKDTQNNENNEMLDYRKELVKLDEESKLKNRLHKSYDVLVSDNNITIPPYCTCCTKPTINKEEITTTATYSTGKSTKTRKISIRMPICEECLNHREASKHKKWPIILFSIVAGIVGMLFLPSIGISKNNDLYLVLSYASAVLGFLISGSVIKLPELNINHSTRGDSVEIRVDGYYSREITFRFTNWKYAKLFSKENEGVVEGLEHIVLGKIAVVSSRNTSVAQSYLKAANKPIMTGVGALVIFTLVFLSIVNNSLWFPTSSQNNKTSLVEPQPSSYNESNNTSYSDIDSVSEEEKVFNRMKSIEDELESLDDEILYLEMDIDTLEDDLEYYERKYYDTNNDMYRYEYNDAIEDYNYQIDKYKETINEYNHMVNEYNEYLD